MNIPANLKYSNDHEWCRIEGEYAYVGITDFAQSQLGDIVFVDVPTVGGPTSHCAEIGSWVISVVSCISWPINIGIVGVKALRRRAEREFE